MAISLRETRSTSQAPHLKCGAFSFAGTSSPSQAGQLPSRAIPPFRLLPRATINFLAHAPSCHSFLTSEPPLRDLNGVSRLKEHCLPPVTPHVNHPPLLSAREEDLLPAPEGRDITCSLHSMEKGHSIAIGNRAGSPYLSSDTYLGHGRSIRILCDPSMVGWV